MVGAVVASRYQIERADRVDTRPQSDFHTDASHSLSRLPLSPEQIAVARERVERMAPDLLHMLGLGDPQPGTPLAPVDVVCPSCGAAVANRCTNAAGRDKEKFCTGRVRLAAQTTAVEALITDIIQEA